MTDDNVWQPWMGSVAYGEEIFDKELATLHLVVRANDGSFPGPFRKYYVRRILALKFWERWG